MQTFDQKFGKYFDGEWVYKFAVHPRFGFWAYNMFYRRLLRQDSFYLKQRAKLGLGVELGHVRHVDHGDTPGRVGNVF